MSDREGLAAPARMRTGIAKIGNEVLRALAIAGAVQAGIPLGLVDADPAARSDEGARLVRETEAYLESLG